jgi:hypothetical protein
LVSRGDQIFDTGQIAEHWDRMGQLYASPTPTMSRRQWP